MTRETVDEMLSQYRFNVGRCGHLTAEIRHKQMQIEATKEFMYQDMASPKVPIITDMPRGGGATTFPVERIADAIADGEYPDYFRALLDEMVALQKELEGRKNAVDHVESWLGGLSNEERWIIENKVLDDVVWTKAVEDYKQLFGRIASRRTLQRLRFQALEKVYEIAC